MATNTSPDAVRGRLRRGPQGGDVDGQGHGGSSLPPQMPRCSALQGPAPSGGAARQSPAGGTVPAAGAEARRAQVEAFDAWAGAKPHTSNQRPHPQSDDGFPKTYGAGVALKKNVARDPEKHGKA